jgi:hypothetical protein
MISVSLNYSKRNFVCFLLRNMIQNEISLALPVREPIQNEISHVLCFAKDAKYRLFRIVSLFCEIKFYALNGMTTGAISLSLAIG